eukprot:4824242-Amphidinium_carterae.1
MAWLRVVRSLRWLQLVCRQSFKSGSTSMTPALSSAKTIFNGLSRTLHRAQNRPHPHHINASPPRR